MSQSQDDEAREEEILALTSIYDQDTFHKYENENTDSNLPSFQFLVRLNDIETVLLTLYFPENYPSESPPFYELKEGFGCTKWITDHMRTYIDENFQKLFEEACGEPVLFTWFEWLQGHLTDEWTKVASQYTSTEVEKIIALEERENVVANSDTPSDNPSQEQLLELTSVFHSSQPLTDRKSVFIAHLATVDNPLQVEQLLDQLKLNSKIRKATHNMWAYRILNSVGGISKDCDDDGETAAGSRYINAVFVHLHPGLTR
jgi:hypothetical protein